MFRCADELTQVLPLCLAPTLRVTPQPSLGSSQACQQRGLGNSGGQRAAMGDRSLGPAQEPTPFQGALPQAREIVNKTEV